MNVSRNTVWIVIGGIIAALIGLLGILYSNGFFDPVEEDGSPYKLPAGFTCVCLNEHTEEVESTLILIIFNDNNVSRSIYHKNGTKIPQPDVFMPNWGGNGQGYGFARGRRGVTEEDFRISKDGKATYTYYHMNDQPTIYPCTPFGVTK